VAGENLLVRAEPAAGRRRADRREAILPGVRFLQWRPVEVKQLKGCLRLRFQSVDATLRRLNYRPGP
jgi:hypothetical protein